MKRLGSLTRPLFAVALVFLIFACSGGGCSGCAGCGIAPIPGGFPIAERIPNSAQVRLSESGIQFVEDNIDGIIATALPEGLDFAIPPSSGSQLGFDFTICPAGDCIAHGEIESFTLDPVVPNRLTAHIRVILDSRDTGGERRPLPVRIDPPLLGAFTCGMDIDTRNGDRDYVGLVANVDFVNETRAARAGYTKIVVSDARLADGEDIENNDIAVMDCGVSWLLNLFRGQLVGLIEDQVSGLINGALNGALCTTRGEFGCPTGTFDRGNTAADATCFYEASGSDECVPTLIGMDGRGDLGAQFLGGFSPGAHAPGQFVLASGGDGEAVNEGMSLFMHGGFMSMDRTFTTSPGHNPCVPLVEPPPLPEIARADGFRGNVIPGTTTATHLGIGIAEDYLDYAGYGMFDSGMLCLGAGTRLSQQLSTGLVSVVSASLQNLAFPSTAAPLTLAIRPQLPPDFTIGTDASAPVLTVTVPQLQIDWYVWSTERYVRFMTYQTDLTIEIDLTVEAGEIVPRIESVVATNSSVFNSELITEPPAALAGAIDTVLSTFAGMLAGSISPFALPEIMGFELDVPADGLRGVADSGHSFLGIFANLRLAAPAPLVAPIETRLDVSDLAFASTSLSPEQWGNGERNTVWLSFGAEGPAGADYEYSHRIDGMTWSHWSSDPRVQLDDDVLLLQARHIIEARARVRGQAHTVDTTPVRRELIIDQLPPELQVSRDGTGAYVAAGSDLVSPDAELQYRFRMGDDAWGEWQSSPRLELDAILLDGGELGVEVKDEAGNVGSATLPLIRGIPNPAGGGSCDCGVAVGSSDRHGPLALFASLLVLGAVVMRRRRGVALSRAARRALTLGMLVLPLVLGAVGCECGGNNAPCNDSCIPAAPPGATAGSICCESTNMCVMYDVDALCDPGFTCPIAEVVLDGTCSASCGECMRKPALDEGQLATDLDLVVAESGEIYVSGYSAGSPSARMRYGDLVFGEVGVGGAVTWDVVDGAPSGPVTNDPDGWRDGVSAPGDDVGRWTSMADSGTALYIAYYDRSNGALRIAIGSPGAWDIHTVDDAGDAGRYASIVLLEGGAPAVAYMRIEPAADDSGRLRSSVQIAVASGAAPGDATDWTITEVAGADMACRPEFCGTGEACLETGACVVPSSDCAEDCGSGTECVAGTCQAALPASWVEDLPPAYGLFANLVRTPGGGLALVWYDRGQGNIYGAALAAVGGTWGAPFLIDGYLRADPASGDSGIGASLFVDAAGTWHVAYVDGAEEVLRYASIASGAVTAREDIDNGASDGTTPHTDGRHVIGDDASIVVTDGGEIRVVYQDSTSHRLMLARRPAGGGAWAVSILDEENHTGFWADQQLVAGTSYVATWWREEARAGSTNGVRVLTVE